MACGSINPGVTSAPAAPITVSPPPSGDSARQPRRSVRRADVARSSAPVPSTTFPVEPSPRQVPRSDRSDTASAAHLRTTRPGGRRGCRPRQRNRRGLTRAVTTASRRRRRRRGCRSPVPLPPGPFTITEKTNAAAGGGAHTGTAAPPMIVPVLAWTFRRQAFRAGDPPASRFGRPSASRQGSATTAQSAPPAAASAVPCRAR